MYVVWVQTHLESAQIASMLAGDNLATCWLVLGMAQSIPACLPAGILNPGQVGSPSMCSPICSRGSVRGSGVMSLSASVGMVREPPPNDSTEAVLAAVEHSFSKRAIQDNMISPNCFSSAILRVLDSLCDLLKVTVLAASLALFLSSSLNFAKMAL